MTNTKMLKTARKLYNMWNILFTKFDSLCRKHNFLNSRISEEQERAIVKDIKIAIDRDKGMIYRIFFKDHESFYEKMFSLLDDILNYANIYDIVGRYCAVHSIFMHNISNYFYLDSRTLCTEKDILCLFNEEKKKQKIIKRICILHKETNIPYIRFVEGFFLQLQLMNRQHRRISIFQAYPLKQVRKK